MGASSLVCLGLSAALSVQGCSSSTTTTNNPTDGGGSSSGSSSGGTSDDGGGSSGGTGTVPPASTGSATTSTTEQNFAMKTIHIGDEKDPTSGKPDWYEIGYNIDGKITTATSTDVCTPAADANKNSKADGNGGIDNSFGDNIVPTLAAVAPNPSATLTSSIATGAFTIMLDVKGLDGTSTQTATGLTGQLFAGVHFYQGPNAPADEGGALPAPTFTTADNWPLDPSFLASSVTVGDGGVLSTPVVSNIQFGSPYVVNGTFVSGGPTEVQLTLTISGHPLTIDIKHAQITFVHSAVGAGTQGIISGVLLTTDFVAAISKVAGDINTSFCPGTATFATLQQTIEQAADIMHDGSNAAGTPCDAISIGLGFDAAQIGLPQVAGAPSTSTADPCADGG